MDEDGLKKVTSDANEILDLVDGYRALKEDNRFLRRVLAQIALTFGGKIKFDTSLADEASAIAEGRDKRHILIGGGEVTIEVVGGL